VSVKEKTLLRRSFLSIKGSGVISGPKIKIIQVFKIT
jgi:hypothetical protein